MAKEDIDVSDAQQDSEAHIHHQSPEQDNQVVFQGGAVELSDDDEEFEDDNVSDY